MVELSQLEIYKQLVLHTNNLFDVKNVLNSLPFIDDYAEIQDNNCNLFFNNLKYDNLKSKIEDFEKINKELLIENHQINEKVKEKTSLVEDLKTELKIINREYKDLTNETKEIENQVNKFRVLINLIKAEEKESRNENELVNQSLNISLSSINTNRFSEINVTMRNFEYNPVDKKVMTSKEKERRIKELNIILQKMEKSVLEAKKRHQDNIKKNLELMRENEQLDGNARQKVLIIEQLNFECQEIQNKIEKEETKSFNSKSTNVTGASYASQKKTDEKKGFMGMMKSLFKKK